MDLSGPALPCTTPAWPGAPGRLFLAATHRAAITAVTTGLRERGSFVALTGDPGLGKTALLNAILAGPSGMAVSVRTLRDESGAVAPVSGRVLVLDDAHAMPLDALESLAADLSVGTLNPLLAQIVFAGRPEFWSRLQKPSLAALRDRITVRAMLFPMPYPEAADYVDHLFRQDGGSAEASLSEYALHEVLVGAQGNPRRLNAGVGRALAAGTPSHRQRLAPQSAQDIAALPAAVWRLRPAVQSRIAWIAATAAVAVAAAVVLAPGMDDQPALRINRAWMDHARRPGELLPGDANGVGKDQRSGGRASKVISAAELPPGVDAASLGPYGRTLLGKEDPSMASEPRGLMRNDGER